VAEGGQATHDTLDTLQVLDQTHLNDSVDLLRIGLDPSLGDDKTKKHAMRDPENAFLGVEPDPVRSEPGKRLFKVGD
jgi:hypothetical protein